MTAIWEKKPLKKTSSVWSTAHLAALLAAYHAQDGAPREEFSGVFLESLGLTRDGRLTGRGERLVQSLLEKAAKTP